MLQKLFLSYQFPTLGRVPFPKLNLIRLAVAESDRLEGLLNLALTVYASINLSLFLIYGCSELREVTEYFLKASQSETFKKYSDFSQA
ncbi:MAG TPA: hypothetical protein V6C57_23935 [Coleofasciculaceae cyanobacterium]